MSTKKKILLVEDDLMLVQMYLLKLQKAGFEVDVAYDGKQGLNKLAKKQYNLILLDLMMPEMDGFTMLEKYNNDKKYNKAPVLVLSNLGQKEDKRRAIELGIKESNYIVKANNTPTEVTEKIKATVS